MEALWRWTSSVFLVLALSIGDTLSQTVEPSLLPQALRGEILRNNNPDLVNLRKINNAFLYPQNGLRPEGPTAPVLENPRQVFQARLCTQCTPNQQAQQACQCNEPTDIIPISQTPFNNVGLINAPNACANPGPLYNTPGKLLPFPQLTPQNPFSIGPPTCLPQGNVGLPQVGMLAPQGPLLPFSKGSSIRSPIESTTGIIPVDNQGTSVDLYSPRPIQCPLNGAPTSTVLSLPSKTPAQEPIPSCFPINNLPQSITVESQCDILPETPPCLSSPIGATSFLPFSPFRFPRPTIFQPSMPFQANLANSVPCDLNTNTANQASVCAESALIQQNSICPQVPTAPTSLKPNILPNLPYQDRELFRLQSFPISDPIMNSGPGPCSFTPDIASINCLPPTFIPPSCAIPPNGFGSVLQQMPNFVDYSITPLNLYPPCGEGTPPVLPTSINRPCNSEISDLCGSAPDSVPVPINLQINVPPVIIPPPTITIINTTPEPDATVSTNTDGLFDFPVPWPPVIIEGRRSRSRSWLPLILVALFASDGDFGGYGGGCSCDSGPIPMPYPIVIPTNNPVIMSD